MTYSTKKQPSVKKAIAEAFNVYFDAQAQTHRHRMPTFEQFCSERVLIRDMHKHIINLQFNTIQKAHLQKKALETNKSKKFLLLKYRRGGITTLEQAQSYYMINTKPHTSCVTLADNQSNTETIFRMVTRMLHLDQRAPRKQGESKSHIEFPDLGSIFHISTAGAKSFGRGDDIDRVHGSEVAFWAGKYEDIDNTVVGLTEACRYGQTVMETTANGAGGWFYEKYSEAMKGENDWVPLFYPWFIDPLNIIPSTPESVTEFLDTIKDDEKLVMERFGLTFPQMLWRRWKKFSLKKLFLQEYPETWEEAFIIRGSSFFDQEMLHELSNKVQPPLTQSDTLTIWEHPLVGHEYVAGGDAAEGNEDSDNCVCGILDKVSGKQVARLKGKWRPEVFARKAVDLCKKYNNAIFACEINNHGHSVMNTVINTLMYRHIYYYSRPIEKDKYGGDKVEKRPGFLTTAQSRPILLNDLNEALVEGFMQVNDTSFINEMKTFVDKGGKFQADTGQHDDLILAWGIAWQCRKQLKQSFIIV